ncbi:LysR family transcriptional regulator [Bordetella genomosp. 11]|nr:LysR family transcriptional regulator [Bordetella genomosp. 11]
MNITIKQLRAFINVVNAGSFTEAAKRLYVTQSALSLLLRDLESELGFRLLDRNSRRMQLSTMGAEFYPLAVKVVDDLDTAVSSTLQLHERQRGSVVVACTLLYGQALMPQILAAFGQRYPAIAVRMLDLPNEQVLSRVAADEADFGIAPQRPTPTGLVQERLFQDRIQLICPADHPFTGRKRVTWTQALAHPFISLPLDFTVRLQADLLAWSKSLTLNPRHSVSYLTTALGMVKWGHGLTALPSYSTPLLTAYGLAGVPVRDPVIHRQVSLFTKRSRSLSPAATSLMDFMHEFMSQAR